MEHLYIPPDYKSELSLYDTQVAIKTVKDFFQKTLAEQLEKLSVTVSMKAGEGGRAFGSVSGKEISKAIKDQLKMDIDKKKFLLPEPLKTFGTHEVPIKLHKDVTAKLAVKVVEA